MFKNEATFKWKNILHETIYICCINKAKANTKANWMYSGKKTSRKNSISIHLFWLLANKEDSKKFIFGALFEQNIGSIASNGLFCLKIITVKKKTETTQKKESKGISIFPRMFTLFLGVPWKIPSKANTFQKTKVFGAHAS